MSDGAINFFLDGVDDPLLADQVPSFDGGMFSNLRANLLQPNQSKFLSNCDVDKLGKLRTRRGTSMIGTGPPSGVAGTIIQGLTFFQTKDYNYIVAANNGLLWKWTGSAWVQIATGGTADNEAILICREGLINQSTVPAGYTAGTTKIIVDGLPAVAAPIFAPGEKLYFVDNRRTDPYEYVIANWDAGTSTITLEEPGLVFDVQDNWKFIVTRPALVNGTFAAGATTIAIDGYSGEVFNSEKFVIQSENITHAISSHTPAGIGTTGLTFSPGLQAAYAAADANVDIVFAQGHDSLFFCDGVGDIYGWNGATTMRLAAQSILDDLQGSTFSKQRTSPPTGCKVLVWFQNRLIASGIAAEPDAIYFSDFFDPTAWDRDYQKVRIGGGESDPITGLLAWTDYNLLVFKQNSIYVINLDPSQNPNPDDPTLLIASFAVKQLHKRIGCPAPRTAVQVGGGSTTPGSDVFFVDGDKRVHSVRRVMAAETQQEVGQAVSLPVQDFLDTINTSYINKACAWYHNEHYLLGLPVRYEGATGEKNSVAIAYNLLTQSWCGIWTWQPTCFAMRTDVGSYSKLIFGDVVGNVVQWMDDVSFNEEFSSTYQDRVPMVSGDGTDIATSILTRAVTFGDAFSYKSGLNVEFEFDESVSNPIIVQVILDGETHPDLIAAPFSTLSSQAIYIPIVIPFVLGAARFLLRVAFDLQRYGSWRELQFRLSTSREKLSIRSIRMGGFMDTIQLQRLPILPTVSTELVVTGGTPPDELVYGDDGATVRVGP